MSIICQQCILLSITGYDFSNQLTDFVHIDGFHSLHGDEKTRKLSLLDSHLLSHGRKQSAIIESSLLFVISLSAIKPLSVCHIGILSYIRCLLVVDSAMTRMVLNVSSTMRVLPK